MKLNAAQLLEIYCILMRVFHPNNPGVTEMLAKADTPAGRARPGPASGLRDAINDLFTMHGGLTDSERKIVDAELSLRGLPHLYIIEASRSAKYRGIIKRGKIRNDDEFYIVKGLLDDPAPHLGQSEMAALGVIMDFYLRQRA